MEWIDNADSWICPLCAKEVANPNDYHEARCPSCGFQATSIPEFSDTLLSGDKGVALLPVGVIYGPNGGGKPIS